jgi:hypothetical protein
MCQKVKIQNTGDWICSKCEAQNSEHKDNIKIINKVLCNSCYSEFELDKNEDQKNEIVLEGNTSGYCITAKVNGEEFYIPVDDNVKETSNGIQSMLNKLGIESKIIDG